MSNLASEALELADDGIVLVDATLTVELANRHAQLTYGFRLGDRLPELIGVEQWPTWTRMLEMVAREGSHHGAFASPVGTVITLSARRRDQGGVLLTLSPCRDEQGVDALVSVLEGPFAQALETHNIGLWHLDAATGQLRWSKGSFDIAGIAPGPISTESFLQRVVPEDQANIAEHMLSVSQGKSNYSPRLRVQQDDGSLRYIHDHGLILRDADDVPIGYVGASLDETELVEARQRIARLEDSLSATDRLRIAGRLALGVAHDLNNILTSLMAYAEILGDQALSECGSECVNHILDASHQAGELSSHLLAFGRGTTLRLKPLELTALVRQSIKMARRTISETVVFTLQSPEQKLWVFGDAARLQQMLFNLLLNAVQAIDGSGVVQLTLERDDEEHALLYVADSGRGMSEATQAEIFEPFFTTRENGTGLGLANVLTTIAQHSGTITSASTLGLGTRFTIQLPLIAPPQPAPSYEVANTAPTTTAAILVVDDALLIRVSVTRLLRAAGYVVEAAPDPSSALKLLQDGATADLLLTDVIMPRMSGPELATEFKKLCPDSPILFMSGYRNLQLNDRGAAIGAGTLLTKPFGRSELLAAVASALADS